MRPSLKATVLLSLLIAIPLHADTGKKLTALPRLFGRTVKNMVTFKDKTAAVHEWMLLAAVTADGVTTRNLLDRGGFEKTRVYGYYPSVGRQVAISGGLTLGVLTTIQSSHELFDQKKEGWKTIPWTVTLAATADEVKLAYKNAGLCRPGCLPNSDNPFIH